MVIIVIALIIGSIFFLFFYIKNKININNMLWHFKNGNVIVSGKKGRGKDLLFQYVIYKRKDFYYSNINYGGTRKIIPLSAVSCAPNTYDSFIKDNVEKTKHMFKEGKDIYISDGGSFLPSQMDSVLHKTYPSMPLYYALSRHLYNSNVHVNTQNLERVWKALREQADFYPVCKRVYKWLPGFLIIKVISYDKYDSAIKGLLPLNKRMNKDSKNQFDLYIAQNGDIRKFYVFVSKRKIKYNTRAFEKVLLKGKRLGVQLNKKKVCACRVSASLFLFSSIPYYPPFYIPTLQGLSFFMWGSLC